MDFQQNCSITFERVMSTCVFVVIYIYILNLIDEFFPSEKWKQINPFFVDNSFFFTTSFFLKTAAFFKKLSTTFCLICQQPYTKSQLPREIFIPVGSFEQLVEWGQETFNSWKRGYINFSSSRSCYHCTTDMLIELYCQQDQSLFQKFW